MKYIIITLLFLIGITSLSAQQYSKVKIDLTNTDIREVAKLGLEADHGHYAKGKHLVNDFSAQEITRLKEAGIPFEILIADVQAFYRAQNHEGHNHGHSHGESRDGHCGESSTTS